jgi:hypothetical protein
MYKRRTSNKIKNDERYAQISTKLEISRRAFNGFKPNNVIPVIITTRYEI